MHEPSTRTKYTYDSFGNIVATSGSIVNNFRYTGREWDSETSLYYYRARYYDPSRGRFVNEDPLGFGGGINFYAYVSNTTINFDDPFGLGPNTPQNQQIQNNLIQQLQNIFPGSTYNPTTNTLTIPQSPSAVEHTLVSQGYKQPGQWWNPFLYWDPIYHFGGDEFRSGTQRISFHFRKPYSWSCSRTNLDQFHIDNNNPAVDPVGHMIHDFFHIP
jgi:RHS repeat-associated protein